MAAFGAAAMASFVALVSLVFLRGSGGWMCLYRLRRTQVADCKGRNWTELTTIERAWFYGAAIWVLAAIAFGALAVALTATG